VNDLSEKEQLEEFRAWWSQNAWFVIGGLLLGIAGLVGWNFWQDRQASAEVAASSAYEALVEQVADGNQDEAGTLAAELFRDYDATPYAAQGRLAMARLYMDGGRDQDAADVLRPLAASGDGDVMTLVARHRLAQILLYQDKPQDVIDLIGTPGDTAFAARFHEVLGDAQLALGNLTQAREAYQAVLADARAAQTVNTALVRMKLDDLPPPAAPAAAGAAE